MTVPTIPDLTQLTDEEFQVLDTAVTSERSRRAILLNAPQQIEQQNKAYLSASGTVEGEEWRQPTGSHDAYPKAWIVTHLDKTWESLVDGNVWEPGVANWREQAADGEYPTWVQPVGSEDAYNMGDRVYYQPTGFNYESEIDANVWAPDVHGWFVINEEGKS